jgi:hypothetical protein
LSDLLLKGLISKEKKTTVICRRPSLVSNAETPSLFSLVNHRSVDFRLQDDGLQRVREMNVEKDGVIQSMGMENRSIREEILGNDDLLEKKEKEFQWLNKRLRRYTHFVKRQKSAA